MCNIILSAIKPVYYYFIIIIIYIIYYYYIIFLIIIYRAAADEMQSCPTSLVLKYLQVHFRFDNLT